MIPFFNYFLFSKCVLFVLCLTCLTGCAWPHLNVQTQYLSHENLASYYVRTPDPQLDHPIIGQRLLVQWSLSPQDVTEDLQLYLKLRFCNHQEQELTFTICKRRGTYVYDLVGQEYCQSGGLLTYKVELRKGECILTSWTHPLWANLISFDFSESTNPSPTEL